MWHFPWRFTCAALCRNKTCTLAPASQSPSLYPGLHMLTNCYNVPLTRFIKAGPPWGYFSHLWSQRINFFLFESSWKKWKMTPLLCACAVVITLETQKCRKRAPRSVEFNFFIICDRHKRFLQNERRRVDLQKLASDFLIFAKGLSYDLSKFRWWFYPVFSTLKDHN